MTNLLFPYAIPPIKLVVPGFFEVQFWTTGKSGASDSWFTNDLETDGYFYYFSGHGGASYSAPAGHDGFPRPSQLTVTSTDQYNFADPSGTLKIDLTGNAEALPPGPIASFDVQANNDDILLTGQWTYSKPLTATGILLEVSGVAKNASLPAGETATGVLIDEPTGTTVFSYPCVPGQAHYFRIRTQNIDINMFFTKQLSLCKTYQTSSSPLCLPLSEIFLENYKLFRISSLKPFMSGHSRKSSLKPVMSGHAGMSSLKPVMDMMDGFDLMPWMPVMDGFDLMPGMPHKLLGG